MCIGIPMKIIQTGLGTAVCEGMGKTKTIDTLFIGEQELGTWVLVFLESAREVLSDEDAKKITMAMSALIDIHEVSDSASQQAWLDHYFSDLTDRPIIKPDSNIDLAVLQQTDKRLENE